MGLIDILFPKKCLSCGSEGRYACTNCIEKLPTFKQLCPYCEKASVDGITHIKCLKKLSIDAVYTLWPYQGVVRTAILKLKYRFATQIAEELAENMVSRLRNVPVFPENSVLVPIPLYFLKENFRGFNQSELIGEILAKKMGWEFKPDILIRKKMRQAQTQLKGDERIKNIRGVFAFNKNYQSPITNYQSLILFDDVSTTGSTLKEAAKVLKRNRARHVWGLTIAR